MSCVGVRYLLHIFQPPIKPINAISNTKANCVRVDSFLFTYQRYVLFRLAQLIGILV